MQVTRILVVEDENIIALDIRYMLENLGYSVSDVASSGEESIRKASAILPDLVLMDIKLKGNMDGIKAAKYIFSHFHIPVVYLTAYRDDNIMNKVRKNREFDFIGKPFEERELQSVIEKTMTRAVRFNSNN